MSLSKMSTSTKKYFHYQALVSLMTIDQWCPVYGEIIILDVLRIIKRRTDEICL